MNTRKSCVVAVLVVAFLMTALASHAVAARAKYRWKTASLAPKGVGYSIHVDGIIMPAIKEACNNELAIKTYWGGIMGDDAQALKKIEIGQLQASGLSGQGTFIALPEVAVLSLPFLFQDYDEVAYIQEKMVGTFDRLLAKKGLRIMNWLDQGFDETYSVDKPMKNAADFAGVRFAAPFGPVEKAMLENLSAIPVSVDPVEIPVTMREGGVDAIVAPSIWVVGSQLYTVFKYVNPLKVRYTPAFFVVSQKALDELPQEYIDNLMDIRIKTAADFNEKAHAELRKNLDAMVEYGLTRVESTPADVRSIRRRVTPVWYELAGKQYSQELLDEVLQHLADYRGGSAPAPAVATTSAPSPPKAMETPAEPADDELAEPAAGATLSPWERKVLRIKRVQKRLQDMGYYKMAVDGIVGPVTYRAIREYQKDYGLPVTGRIDDSLAESLGVE